MAAAADGAFLLGSRSGDVDALRLTASEAGRRFLLSFGIMPSSGIESSWITRVDGALATDSVGLNHGSVFILPAAKLVSAATVATALDSAQVLDYSPVFVETTSQKPISIDSLSDEPAAVLRLQRETLGYGHASLFAVGDPVILKSRRDAAPGCVGTIVGRDNFASKVGSAVWHLPVVRVDDREFIVRPLTFNGFSYERTSDSAHIKRNEWTFLSL
jgi:hypothetical protein